MPSSRSDWDAKHRRAAEAPPSEPAGIVRELFPLLPKGPALDLACGSGRHTLFLAMRGQHVTAVDWSSVALDTLEARARRMHVPARHAENFKDAGRSSRTGIDLLHANLEQTELPEERYDLVLCLQYLQRSLFPSMARALRPGGVLLFETYSKAQLGFPGGPQNPAYLLEIGELRLAFPGLHVLFYRELCAGQGIASLVAKKRGSRG
jgi:tellurite methyltransferase